MLKVFFETSATSRLHPKNAVEKTPGPLNCSVETQNSFQIQKNENENILLLL